ncbi:hypothetical protein KEM52_004881 [Ascosphaera acerosa]|nr:hypothetical protein KEM52_004881 [Ascosphaera acerosa]
MSSIPSNMGEPEISPSSKKVLERFAAPPPQPLPPSTAPKEPSFIFRPKTLGEKVAEGFSFAKPIAAWIRSESGSEAATASTKPLQVPIAQAACTERQQPQRVANAPLQATDTAAGLFLTPSLPKARQRPSEEDLFMMLIGRLKRRDQMEHANRAQKDRLQREIAETRAQNDSLHEQLESVEKCRDDFSRRLQDQERMLEQWRTKFSRLKTLTTEVGASMAELRRSGSELRGSQHSIATFRDQLRNDIQHVKKGTENCYERWVHHTTQLRKVKQGIAEMEASVAVAESRAEERDRAIREERCRVAKLENHIRSYCIRQLKDTSCLHETERETLDKVMDLTEVVKALKQAAINQCQGIHTAVKEVAESLRPLLETNAVTHKQFASIQEAVAGHAARLESTEQSVKVLHQEREQLREEIHELKLQLQRASQDIEKSRQESLKATEAQIAEVTAEMKQHLQASQDSLQHVKAQLRLKESALQELQGELSAATKRSEEATAAVTQVRSEKASLEATAAQTERTIREELTRASLAAKEQDQAWLEQEKHKLNREKEQSMKLLDAMAQQLEITKASLARTNGMYERALAQERDLKAENQELARVKAESERDAQRRIKEFEATVAACQQQLQAAEQDHANSKAELEALQTTPQNNEHVADLQQRLSQLQGDLDTKQSTIAALEEQVQALRTRDQLNAKLREGLGEKATEIASLKRQLEESPAASGAAVAQQSHNDTDCNELHQRLKAVEDERDLLREKQATADEQAQRLKHVLAEKGDADSLLARITHCLRQLGLLSPKQSLDMDWQRVQGQLQTLCTPPAQVTDQKTYNQLVKPTGKRKRTTAACDVASKMRAGEGLMREVVYQTCRIRESGPSPVRRVARPRRSCEGTRVIDMPAPSIKPFSVLHGDTPSKASPGTPAEVKDLSRALITTPTGQLISGDGVNHETTLDGTQSTRKSASENMLLDELDAEQGVTHSSGHDDPEVVPDQDNHVPETQLSPEQATPSDQASQAMPKKGILKESSCFLSQALPAIRTPSNKVTGNASAIEMAVNGLMRRPSHVSSKFFDPLPLTKEGATGTMQPPKVVAADQGPVTRPLRKTRSRYSRKKGNYNERFMKALKE